VERRINTALLFANTPNINEWWKSSAPTHSTLDTIGLFSM
jgi:hypothetical protein